MTAPPPGTRAVRSDLSAWLFNAAGRSGRTSYLLGAVTAGVLMKSTLLIPVGPGRWAWAVVVGFPGFVIWGVFTARRLHDLGLAGWWFALLAGLAVFAPHDPIAPQTPLAWATGAVLAALTVILLLWPGYPRFNRFGPAPGF